MGALSVLLALGACGDDDDELCAAADELGQDVGGLEDLDVVEDGTDPVEESLSTIKTDLSEVREQVPDAAPEEADAFDSALTSLDDAVTAVGTSRSRPTRQGTS